MFGQKERLRENPAADVKVLAVLGGPPRVACNPRTHLAQRRRAVLLPERLPGERARQDRGVREPASADDEVARRVQLEEEEPPGSSARKGDSRVESPCKGITVGGRCAEKVIQLHAVDAKSEVVVARNLARPPSRFLRPICRLAGWRWGVPVTPDTPSGCATSAPRGEERSGSSGTATARPCSS
jgi:hypothetical protein